MHLEVVALLAFLSFGIVFKPGEVAKPEKGVLRPCQEEQGLRVPPAAVTFQLGMSCPPRASSPPESAHKAGTGSFKTF